MRGCNCDPFNHYVCSYHFNKHSAEVNLTDRFKHMIESFECDINIAEERTLRENDSKLVIDLNYDHPRLKPDIELLRELSFGLRNGTLKIVSQEDNDE